MAGTPYDGLRATCCHPTSAVGDVSPVAHFATAKKPSPWSVIGGFDFRIKSVNGKAENIMQVERIDHVVLTVKDISTTVEFYTSIMDMDKVVFGEDRVALSFGNQKINLHQLGNEFEPKAKNVKSGSADLCFIVREPIEQVMDSLTKQGVVVIDGPVSRTGAMGKMISAYFRDPDGNLIEVSNYASR